MRFSRCSTALYAIVAVCVSSVLAHEHYSPDELQGKHFDYIIVGGGLTGLTVANRLSADPSKTVLVIESGNDDRSNAQIWNVSNYGDAFRDNLTWKFPTVPQAGGHIKTLIAGNTLGGSSSINGAAWNRASKAQYDALGHIIGGGSNNTAADGWNWDGLLPYMIKAEGFRKPNQQQIGAGARYNASVHGFNGPLHIGFSPMRDDEMRRRGERGATTEWRRMYTGPQTAAFIKSIDDALGVQHVDDQCAGDANSVAYTPNSIDQYNRRVSAATAYYGSVENRTNLILLLRTRVKQIVWDNNGGALVAKGVKVMQSSGGQEWMLSAAKEVILSAGAINTPVILQRSGVGDAKDLQNLGVATNFALAGVGKNLQDQTSTAMGSQAKLDRRGGGPSATIGNPNVFQIFGREAYNKKMSIVSSMQAWAHTLYDLGHVASIEGVLMQWNVLIDLIFEKNAPVLELFFDTGYPHDSYGFDLWPLLPFARGSVRANSTDPWTAPVVDPNYFGVPIDMDMQVQSLRAARRVMNSAALRSLTLNGETTPGFDLVPNNDEAGDYAKWQSWVLGNLTDGGTGYGAVWHQLGTCQMGKQSLGGVVDQSFTVYGTKNVRVVDASVMPVQVSAHLSATLYGVAEKAADVIIGAK